MGMVLAPITTRLSAIVKGGRRSSARTSLESVLPGKDPAYGCNWGQLVME